MMRSHVSSVLSKNGSILSMPALLTSTSTGPSSRVICATPSATEVEFETSTWTAAARWPDFVSSDADAAARSWSTSQIATAWPAAARCRAIAAPIP